MTRLITILARQQFGWPKRIRMQQRYRARLIRTLSGMAYMLSSLLSLAQELTPPGAAAASEQQVFNNACRTCHTIKEDDNRLGPSLYRIIGREAGSLPNYNYSAAMKDAGFVWDEAKLARFVANPDEVVPGNNMKPYSGLASAEDRQKVVAFLRSMTAR
jgi:cytochrome c